ncbi:hypothetical protein ACFLW6_02920 [Chloroflexota bacterium]
MNKEKINELCTRVADRVKKSLQKGDIQKALHLLPALETEYWNMHKGQALVMAECIIPFIQDMFIEDQKKLTREIEKRITDGDIDKASQLIDEKTERHMKIHDIYIDFHADCFGYIYDYFGKKGLLGCFRRWGELTKKWFEKRVKLTRDEKIEAMSTTWREHVGNIRIQEDKNKTRIILQPCGSGGRRLEREKEGISGRKGISNRIQEEYPLTVGKRSDIPIYCMHCAYLFEELCREWTGQPLRVMNPPEKAGDPCIIEVYD